MQTAKAAAAITPPSPIAPQIVLEEAHHKTNVKVKALHICCHTRPRTHCFNACCIERRLVQQSATGCVILVVKQQSQRKWLLRPCRTSTSLDLCPSAQHTAAGKSCDALLVKSAWSQTECACIGAGDLTASALLIAGYLYCLHSSFGRQQASCSQCWWLWFHCCAQTEGCVQITFSATPLQLPLPAGLSRHHERHPWKCRGTELMAC